MIIDEITKKDLENIYHTFLCDERILKMQEIPMHRGSNCYIHSFKVAKLAMKRALRHKQVDLYIILLAAILHDYYLYDWRSDRSKMKRHLKDHPHLAAENAVKDFGIHQSIKKAIEAHMWPINIKKFPSSKEARIISLADKSIYWKEIMCSKAYKQKKKEKYLKEIETLFE